MALDQSSGAGDAVHSVADGVSTTFVPPRHLPSPFPIPSAAIFSLQARSETPNPERSSSHRDDSVRATAVVEGNGDKELGNKELGDVEKEKEDSDGKTEQSSSIEKEAGDGIGVSDPGPALAPSVKAENGIEEQNGAETEAEDESKYPGGFALGILTFGLCMATFVVALDNTIIGELSRSKSQVYRVASLTLASNCDTEDNHCLRLPQRCRLVRLLLPPHYNVAPTIPRQGLHLLQRQMDLPRRYLRLRARLHHMRSGRQLTHADRRPCHSWSRSIRAIFRGNDHNRLFGPASTPRNIYRSLIQHVWHLFRDRTHHRWGVHRSSDVAMVFLDKLAHWCDCHHHSHDLLQEPNKRTQQSDL